MKIAVISDSRYSGGAALATARVFKRLEENKDIQVRWFIASRDAQKSGSDLLFTQAGRGRSIMQDIAGWVGFDNSVWVRQLAGLSNRRNLLRHLTAYQPDIISLHSINQWTNSLLDHSIITDLCKYKPVVWTMHDMWPLTGYTDYPLEFVDSSLTPEEAFCGVFGPGTPSEKGIGNLRKCHERLVLVGPSRWMCELASRVIEERIPVEHITHGVNLEEFRPFPQKEARHFLDVEVKQPVVAAVATHLHAKRKGLACLIEAIGQLNKPVTLIVAGGRKNGLIWPRNAHVIDLGPITDMRLLRLVYCAADVFVLPSLSEVFGLVLVESLACGTPCVGFQTGGISEIIRPGVTGELAKRGDTIALAEGLNSLLTSSPEQKSRVRCACRSLAEREYDINNEAKCYANLFSRLTTIPLSSHGINK